MNNLNYIRRVGGVYVLLLYLAKTANIRIGAIGTHNFKRGWHAYFGSAHAGGGVYARCGRHARLPGDRKTNRWNVDYFREHATLVEVWFAHLPAEFEHRWSQSFARLGISSVPVKRMGGWDCRKCPAHFYKLKQRPPTSLLRNAFDTQSIQTVEVEPKRAQKYKLEWEADYWAGRRILECTRFEYYRRDEAIPSMIANVTGNPVLRDLVTGPKSDVIRRQITLANAVDSLIVEHGEEAHNVIFDRDKPQTRKDILAISRKSWERQFERICMVSDWDERSLGPQPGDSAPDTMTFGKILSRIGRACGPLRIACEHLKPQLNQLGADARSSILTSLTGYKKHLPELTAQVREFDTADNNQRISGASKPTNKLTIDRLHIQIAAGVSMLKKSIRDIPQSSYDLRPNAQQKQRALEQLKGGQTFLLELTKALRKRA